MGHVSPGSRLHQEMGMNSENTVVKDARWNPVAVKISLRDSENGKEWGFANNNSRDIVKHWDERKRRDRGETPCPTERAAEDMGTSQCQHPLTHPLAALWHCVEVSAPQCAHMMVTNWFRQMGVKSRSHSHPCIFSMSFSWLIALVPVYSVFLKRTLRLVLCSTATHVKIHRATICLKGWGGHCRNPLGGNGEAQTVRVELTAATALCSQVADGDKKDKLKIHACLYVREMDSSPSWIVGVRLKCPHSKKCPGHHQGILSSKLLCSLDSVSLEGRELWMSLTLEPTAKALLGCGNLSPICRWFDVCSWKMFN